MTDPIEDRLDEALSRPQSLAVDGQSVTNRSIDDEIKADQYKKRTQQAKSKRKGLSFIQIYSPGANR